MSKTNLGKGLLVMDKGKLYVTGVHLQPALESGAFPTVELEYQINDSKNERVARGVFYVKKDDIPLAEAEALISKCAHVAAKYAFMEEGVAITQEAESVKESSKPPDSSAPKSI